MRQNRRLGAFRVEDVHSQARNEFWLHYGLLVVTGIAITVGIFWLMFYLRRLAIETGQEFNPGIFAFGLAPLFPGFYIYDKIKKRYHRQFLEQIPGSLRLFPSKELDFIGGSPAHIFQGGTFNMTTDMFSGTYNNVPVRLYTHHKSVGGGDSSTEYESTTYDLAYPKPLPHILINFGRERPEGTEKLELDEKFSDMRVRVETGKEHEARAILQQDLVQKLYDNLNGVKVEIVTVGNGSMIYFYSDCKVITNMNELINFVQGANSFYDLFVERFKK